MTSALTATFQSGAGRMAGQEDRARDKEAKVRQYETFLNETLRGDLRRSLEERDGVYQEQAEFLALRYLKILA